MYLFLIIFIFLLIVQILMALFATKVKKGLRKKYSYFLGEQIEFNRLLENYQKIHPNLNIIATDELNDVCIAENNLIIVSKKSIYAKDLYSNLYLLFQLKLTDPRLKDIRNIYSFQSITFFFQIFALILFFLIPTIDNLILIICYVILLLTIFLVIYGIVGYRSVLKNVREEAIKLLSLDAVELARADTLMSEIKYEVLTYPLEIPWRLTRFWSF